jgi:uncharacterized protein (TIGR02246 family)
MKRLLPLVLTVLLAAIPAAAQKNKNRKNPQPDNSADSAMPPTNDNQKIDTVISQMLAAWQVGAVDEMHKYYAEDVCVVSGAWEQPIFGWDAYSKAYSAQRSRVQGGQLDRTNTLIKVVDASTAWATYQWQYVVAVDGQPQDIRGHTTLVFTKQADVWVIALNHTSLVSDTTINPVAPPSVTPVPMGQTPAPPQ